MCKKNLTLLFTTLIYLCSGYAHATVHNSLFSDASPLIAENPEQPCEGQCVGDDIGDDTGSDDSDTPAKKKLKIKLMPTFYLDFDFGHKIVNITPFHKSSFNAVSDTLIYGDFSSGFMATKYYSIDAGIGGKLNFYYNNTTGLTNKLWATVGLIPFKGRELVSNRYALTLNEAMNANALKVPSESKDFSKWTAGDSVNYASRGGIIFSSGVGVGVVGINSEYVAQGVFQTYVEKINTDEVYVRISKMDVNSLSVQVGTILTSVGVSKFKEIEEGMSYMINIKDDTGAKAYHDLIRGNVVAIQKLIADPNVTAIKKWEQFDRKRIGRLAHFSFGIPIIAIFNWSSGKIYELNDTRSFYDHTRASINYGIFLREKRKHIFKSHTVKTEAFYGAAYNVTNDLDQMQTKSRFGQYIYTAEDDKTDQNDISKAINDLSQKTGLQKELALNVPRYKHLKYSKVELEVTFDEETTMRLMDKVLLLGDQALENMTIEKTNSYFSQEADTLGLCVQSENPEIANVNCEEDLHAQARAASKELTRAARAMKQHYTKGNDKQFVLAYADFGKAMMKNALIFQTGLGLAGPGVEMIYTVQSTYFSLYTAKFITTATPGKYVKSLNFDLL